MGFADVRENFDWQEYVEDHFEYKNAANGELRVNCPHPKCDDYKKKCYVNPEKGQFFCFKCRFSSKNFDVYDFVAFSEGVTRAVALRKLFQQHTPTTPETLTEDDLFPGAINPFSPANTALKVLPGLPKGCLPLAHGDHPIAAPYWEYLTSRGMTPQEIRAASTHFCPLPKSNLYQRVVWPVYGGDGDLVSWVSRTIDANYTGHSAYLNCPESDIKKTVWPYIQPKEPRAIIVEGIIDCLAVRRQFPVVYATLGKSMSSQQLVLLHHWGIKSVVLFWDIKDARKEMESTVEALKMHFEHVSVGNFSKWQDPTKDPGDALKHAFVAEDIKYAVDNAIDVDSVEYLEWMI